MSNKIFEYEYETRAEKLARKSRDSPFMVIGLLGMVTACSVGAYKFKNKGGMSTSVFLMQLRVIAQGSVIGCLTAGLIYGMINEHIMPKKTP